MIHDDCAAFHPTRVASPFFASLGLERHGLRWLWPEIDLAHPLDDGRAGLAARDRSHTERSLVGDARLWEQLFASATSNFDALIAEVFRPVAHVPRHPVVLGRFGLHALQPHGRHRASDRPMVRHTESTLGHAKVRYVVA
ncbi:hypothetical protein [Nocardia africana]|uniref:hypothetical protein n=1 Tax=Nocardia africana TaxID=134964 RepID=UPI000AD244A9|nr:hypothetical protein [Nocardia africana]MCC3312980.1 hypothetical protein [Nocardia africana]